MEPARVKGSGGEEEEAGAGERQGVGVKGGGWNSGKSRREGGGEDLLTPEEASLGTVDNRGKCG